MTKINGLLFGEDSYTLNNLIEILKEKGRYYKCGVCEKNYVEKEGGLCESCKYKALPLK